jgi:hypothetical protein
MAGAGESGGDMRERPSDIAEICRRDDGRGYSPPYANYGYFSIPSPISQTGEKLSVIVSDGLGWDHVSVSLLHRHRCPTWEEMCYIKAQFFSEDETVVQFIPAKKEYVNIHPYCLHLWRKHGEEYELPNPVMV